jgi:hydroxyethylthiazole kinase-like uncharacterized protein yjeF
MQNLPELWADFLPRPAVTAHKYSRGHVAVFSGGRSATGAARLAALAAARAGAGAVTVLSPPDAMAVNAAHLTSIMLRETATLADARAFIESRKVRSAVFGPGLEVNDATAGWLVELVSVNIALVADASALTAAARNPAPLWEACENTNAPLVFTPHEGEFAKLFPDIAGQGGVSKVEKARAAAKRANGVIVYKGPDTVITTPDGRAAINANGSAWLATAGSGDVLAGIIAGLLAQGMPAFEAACAAVWVHAEAGSRFGPGLIAEDLPGLLPPVFAELYRQ